MGEGSARRTCGPNDRGELLDEETDDSAPGYGDDN